MDWNNLLFFRTKSCTSWELLANIKQVFKRIPRDWGPRILLLVTSPWCFFLAHPFLLLKSLIVTFECSRPPTFHCGNLFKRVRCNPDVAPRLTSGGYEDKVDVITPINILFRGGGKCWPLMKIKLMLLPQSTYCSEGVANFEPSWK